MKKIKSLISVIVGLVVFAAWMNIVGNPHVVETVLGLFIGLAGGYYAWRLMATNHDQ